VFSSIQWSSFAKGVWADNALDRQIKNKKTTNFLPGSIDIIILWTFVKMESLKKNRPSLNLCEIPTGNLPSWQKKMLWEEF
jgi:hypothetical protein